MAARERLKRAATNAAPRTKPQRRAESIPGSVPFFARDARVRRVRRLVTRILRELRAQGLALVYVSHRLEEIFEIADRVTVLRDGAVIETRPASGLSRAELIRLMVGRELS